MFTGLIRESASVGNFKDNILTVISAHKPQIGDSIAINGVCLSVVKVNSNGFDVEIADETRSVVNLASFKPNSKVHIEPAMKMGERFEGHVVQGHVDCVGEIGSITSRDNGSDFVIKVKPECIMHIVPKGSIAIDGVSLTVNDVYEDSFRLTIIPHTLENTLLGEYKIGTKVNIETDMFARYIEHILSHKTDKSKKIGWDEIDRMQMSF